jgi:Major tropism determinant N-terminal domain
MAKIKLRRDSQANWAASANVPVDGEPIWNSTTRVFKMGNGISAYSALPTLTAGYWSLGQMTPAANAVMPAVTFSNIANVQQVKFLWYLVCLTASNGYAVGDRVASTVNNNIIAWSSATQAGLAIGNALPQIIPKTGGAPVAIVAANWQLQAFFKIVG